MSDYIKKEYYAKKNASIEVLEDEESWKKVCS